MEAITASENTKMALRGNMHVDTKESRLMASNWRSNLPLRQVLGCIQCIGQSEQIPATATVSPAAVWSALALPHCPCRVRHDL